MHNSCLVVAHTSRRGAARNLFSHDLRGAVRDCECDWGDTSPATLPEVTFEGNESLQMYAYVLGDAWSRPLVHDYDMGLL
jgi:hypothetical protein